MASDERIRRALLAGLTVAALAAGAGWWRAAAPELGRPAPVPDPTPSTAAFLEPGVRVIDPRTGQVLPGPEADPDEPVVLHVEPDGTVERRQVTYEVWRERSHLTPDGAPVTRRANASDAVRFRLTVGCSGPGAVAVGFTGSTDDESEQVMSCVPGTVSILVVSTTGGPLLVRFVALRDRVDLDARLDALT
ncbi:hypothetical protein ABZV78_07385 [Micromonospora sp. NPDC004540]|uniref:hypothetical protein n=1 Tax=Micromonospora sp. NPDC004540 TaxID=3154457 RepID=UPI0033BDFBBB